MKATESANRELLQNIARTHREHERFYSVHGLELAAELAREAVKLKLLADRWLESEASPPPQGSGLEGAVDYQHPWYQAAGCEDLNSSSAVAMIGILFTEGAGEPPELRALKTKLAAQAQSLEGVARYLDGKMEAAWEREKATLEPELLAASFSRYQTIITNYMSARYFLIAGKALALAHEILSCLDFTPVGVRANRKLYGEYLLLAGWFIDEAVQVLARQAAGQLSSDPYWTDYLNQLQTPR